MVIVSAGMRKAGSLWYYNLTNDLLVAAGFEDFRQVVPHFPVRSFVGEDKIKCGGLDLLTLTRLAFSHYTGHAYPAKTHSPPSRALRFFSSIGAVKATYIYRDPRDVVVSILDHAIQSRAAGVTIDLSKLHETQESIEVVKGELVRWEAWMGSDEVLKVRYEDLVADTVHELERLAQFLGLDVAPDKLREIAAPYQRETYAETMEQPIINDIHLNKGIPGRFRSVLSEEEIALCEQHFAPYLKRMGYAWETSKAVQTA